MYLYVLIITIFFLLLFNIFFFNKDLLSPPVVVCAVFLLSSICSIYNYKFWEFSLHLKTYLTVTYGLVLFSVVSFIVEKIYRHSHLKINNSNSVSLKVINVSNVKLSIFNILVFVLSLWYAIEIIKIARRYGYSTSLSDITSIYRNVSSYGVLSLEDGVNFFCSQLYKFVVAISYVSLYIFFNNVVASKKIKPHIKFLIPCIIYMVMSLISAGRYQLIRVFSAAIFMYYILYMKHNTYKSKIGLKFIFKCAIGLVLFCILFFFLSGIIGRKTDKDILYYITFYSGGSIPLLDSFLQYPPAKSDIFGKETFYSINSFIGKYFNVEKLQYIIHHEFRKASTGLSMGNVYTVFRRMLYDFGYSGMTVLYSICALFYTIAYNKIKIKPTSNSIDISIIFYAYISYGLTMQFYEEAFFTSIISFNTLLTFIMIYLCKFIYINVTYGKLSNKKLADLGRKQCQEHKAQ